MCAMTDIVERLRNPPPLSMWSALMEEAAAEIERLRESAMFSDRFRESYYQLEAENERLQERVTSLEHSINYFNCLMMDRAQ